MAREGFGVLCYRADGYHGGGTGRVAGGRVCGGLVLELFNGSGASSFLVSPTTSGGGASPSVSGSLVVPGVQILDGGQQMQAQRQAELASPSAVTARQRSRTEFEHLGAVGAARVAREAFPEVIDQLAGGPPSLPRGERIVRYVGLNAAQLELPGGKHAVVESMGPMAKESSPGHYVPLDLGLANTGNNYAPIASDVALRIPKQLSAGVHLQGSDVSLTPVDAQGRPLSADGSLDEEAVLYANTQADTDTVLKPTASGFEVDTLLRSVASPKTFYFRSDCLPVRISCKSTAWTPSTPSRTGRRSPRCCPRPRRTLQVRPCRCRCMFWVTRCSCWWMTIPVSISIRLRSIRRSWIKRWAWAVVDTRHSVSQRISLYRGDERYKCRQRCLYGGHWGCITTRLRVSRELRGIA